MKQSEEAWTPLKVLSWTTTFLQEKGVENARREAEWMLCAATGLDRIGLYLNFDKPMNDNELTSYRNMVVRRGKREPLQHILGSQEFDGLDFLVTPAVLIPRQDTEVLVSVAARLAPNGCSLLDIGTGSGCIAIALAKRLPDATITATDISPDAIAIASQNSTRHHTTVDFRLGSLFQPVTGRQFDLIVSNPPYIPSQEIRQLQPEVSEYDPLIALDGGEDGLSVYRQLIASAPFHLKKGGWLLLEAGAGQAAELVKLLAEQQFGDILTEQDHGGHQRVVGGVWYGND